MEGVSNHDRTIGEDGFAIRGGGGWGEGVECTLELRHGVKGVVAVRCKIIVRQHWLLRIVCSR